MSLKLLPYATRELTGFATSHFCCECAIARLKSLQQHISDVFCIIFSRPIIPTQPRTHGTPDLVQHQKSCHTHIDARRSTDALPPPHGVAEC